VRLVLLSADESDAAVDAFRRQHGGVASSLRIADPGGLAAWASSIGLAAPTLPIHVFVDRTGHVRCARAGAVDDDDFAAVQALIAP
jgi:hypothetical protein